MTDDERLSDFERWVRIGLGRALQWVDKHGDEAQREFLARICLVETAYDQQIEGSRAAYVHELLTRTPAPEYYRKQVLDALRGVEDDSLDDRFLVAMGWQYAASGDEAFRAPLHDLALSDHDAWVYALQRVALLDGVSGIVKVARKRSSMRRYRAFSPLEWFLELHHGEERAPVELSDARRRCPELDAMLQEEEEAGPPTLGIGRGASWAEIRDHLSVPGSISSFRMRSWAFGADESDLVLAAEDLLSCSEDDPWRILHLLQAFSRAPFPGPVARILAWAQDIRPIPEVDVDRSSPESIVHWAAQAIVRNERPEVRAFGRCCELVVQKTAILITGEDSLDQRIDHTRLSY